MRKFALLVLLLASACAAQAPLKGTDLGREPAPPFQLADSSGRPVALADLRGKVVVLTFLYTRCPDECPLIAEKLRAAAVRLGSSMERVAFVAVSVDPENDTAPAVDAFLREHRLRGTLLYLIGAREQLEPVWAAYYVAAQSSGAQPASVAHSARVIVIDQAGNQRANLGSDLDPDDLVFDVRALLGE